MTISILLSFYHVLPHIVMPFFNILRSSRVCVHARVFVHAYESGRNYIKKKKKKKKKNDLFPTTTTFSHKLYKFELYIQLEKDVNKKC